MVSCKQSTEENFLKRIKEMNNTNGYNPFPPSLLRDFENQKNKHPHPKKNGEKKRQKKGKEN
jgi:hypothetical protein